ncbi:hypothetical protein SCALM49S_02096 [Streptomyces californicus]
MVIRGVLFDFSGTLFRIEPVRSWLAAVLREEDVDVPPEDFERYVTGLTESGALPAAPRRSGSRSGWRTRWHGGT